LFLFLISFIIKLYFLIKNHVLLSSKKIFNLKEGDVISKNYYLIGNKLIIRKIGFFKQIKLLLKNNYYDNLKIDSNKAGGLSSSDIKFLKTMYEDNIIGASIYIKKTIAFTPVLLVSYILLNIFGDFIWLILI